MSSTPRPARRLSERELDNALEEIGLRERPDGCLALLGRSVLLLALLPIVLVGASLSPLGLVGGPPAWVLYLTELGRPRGLRGR